MEAYLWSFVTYGLGRFRVYGALQTFEFLYFVFLYRTFTAACIQCSCELRIYASQEQGYGVS